MSGDLLARYDEANLRSMNGSIEGPRLRLLRWRWQCRRPVRRRRSEQRNLRVSAGDAWEMDMALWGVEQRNSFIARR